MSQINLGNVDHSLDHYNAGADLPRNTGKAGGKQSVQDQVIGQQPDVRRKAAQPPAELAHARPAPKSSSGWSAGRVAACFLTAGISELLRWAWRGIMSCCSSSRAAPAPEPRTETVNKKALPASAPRSDVQNSTLTQAITGKAAMPAAYQAAVDELLEELRGEFGSKYVPEGKTVMEMVRTIPTDIDPDAARLVFQGVKNAAEPLTPEGLKNLLRRHFEPGMKKLVLADMAKAEAGKLGGLGGLDMTAVTLNQLRAPGLKQKLDACRSMKDVQDFFSKMGLGKTVTGIKGALDGVMHDLQAVYGKDALPDDLEAVLQTGNLTDQETLKTKLKTKFNQASGVLSPADAKEFARTYLQATAQHNFICRAVEQAAGEQSVPVTPRSVHAMAKAILNAPGNKEAIGAAKDPQDLARIVKGMVSGLIPAQKAAMEEVYAQHEGKLPPEQKPLLRAYIQGFSFAPADAEASRQAVDVMAGYMQNWKNLNGSEEEMQEMNEVFRQAYARDLKTLEADGIDPTGYEDNMYSAMVRDANRNVFTVNGTKINPKNGQQELVGQLKSHLPDAQDQRFISKLINQRMQGDWQMLIANGTLPDGRMAEQVPGTAGIPVKPGGNMMFQSDLKGVSNTYEVTVAPDGKTATVTSTSTSALHFLDGQKISGAMTSYGAVRYTYNFTLTLSGHQDGQGVTSFSVGQQFMTTEEALATGAKLS